MGLALVFRYRNWIKQSNVKQHCIFDCIKIPETPGGSLALKYVFILVLFWSWLVVVKTWMIIYFNAVRSYPLYIKQSVKSCNVNVVQSLAWDKKEKWHRYQRAVQVSPVRVHHQPGWWRNKCSYSRIHSHWTSVNGLSTFSSSSLVL